MGIDQLMLIGDNNKLGAGYFLMGSANNSNVSYPEHDYSIPHNDYFHSGTYESREEGGYLIYSHKLNKFLAIVAKGGISIIEYTEVNTSRVTYETYKGNVDSNRYTVYELGLSYQMNKSIDLGLSYNNRRGIVFDLGLRI